MQSYAIMHGERHVATINSDGTCALYEPSFLPYNLVLEQDESLEGRINNLQNFTYWCATRVLTLDRTYAKEILNSIGKRQAAIDKDRAEIALSYHCLSLTDVYWARKLSEDVRYAQINLYEHSLSDAFVDVSLRGKMLTAQNAELLQESDYASDASTMGVAPKAWIRQNGSFYLLKDGSKRDVEAEILASRIAQCFQIDQVVYEIAFYQGQAVSCCRLLTNAQQSIVPMEHMEIYCANHDMDLTEYVLKMDAVGYYRMNILDYLLGNTDRHWGNWGFLVDNETNQPIKLHPLMDFNKAFLSYDTPEGAKCLTVRGNVSQLEAAIEGVKRVGLGYQKTVAEEWFTDKDICAMFFQRLSFLQQYE